MKIGRTTSPLLDAPRQLLPRLWHGRQLALLFHLGLTLNLYTLSFACSPSSSSSSSSCSFPRKSASAYAAYLRSHFSVSQSKALRSRARGYLSELRRATCPEESHSSFCSLFSQAEFHAAAYNLFSSTAAGPDKVAYPMLKHLPRSGMDFLHHIFNLSWSSHSFPSIWKTSIIPIHKMGKPLDSPPSGLSLSPPAYQSFLNALKKSINKSTTSFIQLLVLSYHSTNSLAYTQRKQSVTAALLRHSDVVK